MSYRDFRRLVLAYYRRLRKGGLTRIGARDLVGELVNSAHAVDLFYIHGDLKFREDMGRIAGQIAARLASPDADERRRSRAAMPPLLDAMDTNEQLIQWRAREVRNAL